MLLELCQDPGSCKAKKGLSPLFFSLCATVARQLLVPSPPSQPEDPNHILSWPFPNTLASKSKEHRLMLGEVQRLYIFAFTQTGKVKLGRLTVWPAELIIAHFELSWPAMLGG